MILFKQNNDRAYYVLLLLLPLLLTVYSFQTLAFHFIDTDRLQPAYLELSTSQVFT